MDQLIQNDSIQVDKATIHNDLFLLLKVKYLKNHSYHFSGSNKEGPFHYTVWNKCDSIHAAMIKWPFYLHQRSSVCYSTLRNSGVIHLLSERTLSDYRHFVPLVIGFSKKINLQLLEILKQQKPALSRCQWCWIRCMSLYQRRTCTYLTNILEP